MSETASTFHGCCKVFVPVFYFNCAKADIKLYAFSIFIFQFCLNCEGTITQWRIFTGYLGGRTGSALIQLLGKGTGGGRESGREQRERSKGGKGKENRDRPPTFIGFEVSVLPCLVMILQKTYANAVIGRKCGDRVQVTQIDQAAANCD